MAGRDDFEQVAKGTPAKPGLEKGFREKNVQDVLEEFRKQEVTLPELLTSSASGTDILTAANNTLQIVSGTASNYTVQLPDATTLSEGMKFNIANLSSQAISLDDDGGNLLAGALADDVIFATLADNSTSDGVWIIQVISTIASGVQAFNVVSHVTFVTDSATDVLITGMTETPPQGTYAVWFSAETVIEKQGHLAQCVVYKGGTEITDSRRDTEGQGNNFRSAMQTLSIIQVNGSEALDVRVNVDGTGAGDLDVIGRSFLGIRLGS